MTHGDRVHALLRQAAEEIEVPPAPVAAMMASGRRHQRMRLTRRVSVAAAGLAVIALGVPTAVDRQSAPSAAGCSSKVPTAVLPSWARTGFSAPRPRARYVVADRGQIMAILFGWPLSSPPAPTHSNKILWVENPTKKPGGSAADDPALRVEARLANGSEVVVRTVPGGPGPSIIDLPRVGCWDVTLRWRGYTDHLRLAYAPS